MLLSLAAQILTAAPFSRQFKFTQPDGSALRLFGEGDEFSAVFETLDGYTVVFDEAFKGYCYAELSADGNQLLSTGVPAGGQMPPPAGVTPHLRISEEAAQKQISDRYNRWESGMQIRQRWSALKASTSVAYAADTQQSPPSTPTIGTKVGLTLLIDFDDDPATVPQAEIINFCNGDNYTGYRNACSVKKYYKDMSAGRLTYSNVVTIYIRAPQAKTNYNDIMQDAGQQANLLIKDALDTMKALTNYATDILPAFDALTVDGRNEVVAFNVFYAGDNGGRWSYGLWPHSWSLVLVGAQYLSPGGKRVYRYQITNIGDELEIATFCHENGHMLCGYPDLYDYTYRSRGVGDYCLMGYSGDSKNPVQICAYLKRASGWATTLELTSASSFVATVGTTGTNYNTFYRYTNPNAATEYFIVEDRHKSGHDASLPASGVLVWHIDELGDNSSVNLNPNRIHNNFEATVVQADGLWELERNRNYGNTNDLYFQGNGSTGYKNELTDSSKPNSHWWDGSNSGFAARGFTAAGPTMSFWVGVAAPAIVTQPTNVMLVTGSTAVFSVSAIGAPPLSYQWRKGSTALPTRTAASLILNNVQMADAGTYSVLVYNPYGSITSSNVVLTVAPRIPIVTTQPENVAALVGTTVGFSVTAIGGPPLAYQWSHNGNDISGATDTTYNIRAVAQSDGGLYAVRISNPYGSVTSSNAVLEPLLLASLGDNTFGQYNVAVGTTNVTAVGAGGWHNLALRADGTVTAWGDNWNGQCDVPEGLTNVTAIAGGGYHSLAVTASGNVVGWGADDYGQATPPAGLTQVQAIAAGSWHSLALRKDGTVVAWGDDSWGQCDVPAGLANVVAIAAGGSHNLALRADGTVVAWGENTDAQGIYVGQSTLPWGLGKARAIAAGDYHSAVITADGGLVLWGDNSQGQCQAPGNILEPISIAGGGAHTVVVKSDGTAAAWGDNSRGQTSFPASIQNVVAVSAGAAHTLVLVAASGQPLQLLAPRWSAGTFSVQVKTISGRNYSLEYRNSLTATNWYSLPAIPGIGSLQVLSDTAANAPQRFYRVRQW